MLERRASTAPPWLIDETTKSVRRVAQRRGGRAGLGTRGRLAAVGGVVAAVALVAGGLAIGSGLVGTTAATSPAATADVGVLASSAPSEEPRRSESAAPTRADGSTRRGTRCRLDRRGHDRPAMAFGFAACPGSAPTRSCSSRCCRTRHPGARRRRPGRADGYDWYQVYAEEPGPWPAGSPRAMTVMPWIRPGKPQMPGETLDECRCTRRLSIDLLVCFQGRRGSSRRHGALGDVRRAPRATCGTMDAAHASGRRPGRATGLAGARRDRSRSCDTGGVATRDIVVAPSVAAEDLDDSSRAQPRSPCPLTIRTRRSAAPGRTDARRCEPWRAVLACRLMPVVEAVRPDAPIDVEGP